MTLLSIVIAVRGVLELVLWLILGRCILAILAGQYGANNAVMRMFDFLLRPVRAGSICIMPNWPSGRRDAVCFIFFLLAWLGLGMAKLVLASG